MSKLPFQTDPRFEQCKREMYITYAVQIIFTIVLNVVGFSLAGKPLSEYTFYLGMPSWWFIALLIALLFVGAIIYISLYVFKDCKVDPYIEN
jgi:uncharacterized membrane protein YhdT